MLSTANPTRRARQTVKSRFKAKRSSVTSPRGFVNPKTQSLTVVPITPSSPTSIEDLPAPLTLVLTDLSQATLNLLHTKEHRLRNSKIQTSLGKPNLAKAVRATLVFAQEEAGTAVCISPTGMLLTCSHCVAESSEELSENKNKKKWLLFSSGQIVQAECVAWDPNRDLALLQIVAAQSLRQLTNSPTTPPSSNATSTTLFPFVSIAEAPPSLRATLICIGHPGSEDLEASLPGVQTGYDVLQVSTGLFRGYASDQDLQDNSIIGSLKHDCWTYWGYSGAPLINKVTGRLIGLHSSWDEDTGMRRGVPLEAISQFVQQHAKILISD